MIGRTKRLGLMLGVLSLLPFTVYAQERSSKFELSLSTNSLMTCLDSSLPLKLVITNRSEQPQSFDESEVWKSFSYSYSEPNGPGRGGGYGASCFHCTVMRTVKPGESFETDYDFPLSDFNRFFKDAGEYTLKTALEGDSSNQLTFRLFDCNPK